MTEFPRPIVNALARLRDRKWRSKMTNEQIPWWELPDAPGENRTREQYNAEIAALKEPRPQAKASSSGWWLPIRTAPRDGTPILCFRPDALGHGFSDQSGIDVLWWEGGDWTYDGDGRVTTDPPTHWMPLPSGPHGPPKRLPATRQTFELTIAALNYDGNDINSLTVGEIRRALP